MKQKQRAIVLAFLLSSFFSFAQNVGIGTNTPAEKLEVAGALRIGMTYNASPVAGTVRWNPYKNEFEGYNGSAWISFSGGRGKWGNTEAYATETGGTEALSLTDTLFGSPISASGDRLAIGAPKGAQGNYDNVGMVEVNLFSPNGFGYFRRVYAPQLANNTYFGKSLQVAGDAMIVGEPGATVGGNAAQGKAHVYKFTGTNTPELEFTLQQLDADGGPFDRFGSAVAMAHSDLAAAGAPEKIVNGKVKQGRVYLFRRLYILGQPTGSFVADGVLNAPTAEANMQFGAALSMTPTRIAVGAPYGTAAGVAGAGKVFIYSRVNGTWQLEDSVRAYNLHHNGAFGAALRLSAGGDTLVVGEPEGGSVSLYRRNGTDWVFSALIRPTSSSLPSYAGYGASVDYRNGEILVGADGMNVGLFAGHGKAYVFTHNGTEWQVSAVLAPRQGENYLSFGAGVQLTDERAIVGAPGYQTSLHRTEKGRVYWFDRH